MNRRLAALKTSSLLSTVRIEGIGPAPFHPVARSHPVPIDVDKLFDSAVDAQDAGLLETARRLNLAVLAADRNHAGALFCLALIESKAKPAGFLSSWLAKAMVAHPGLSVVLLKLGMVLSARNASPAEKWLVRSCALTPNNPEPYEQLGTHCINGRRYVEAYQFFGLALIQDPAWYRAWNNWGAALTRDNNTIAALSILARARHLNPKDADIWSNIGKAQLDLGQLPAAEISFKQAITSAPDRPENYRLLGEVHRFTAVDPYFAALKHLQDQKSLSDPDRCELAFALAKAFSDIGNHDDAFEQLRRGNRIKRRSISYDERAVLGEMAEIKRQFCPEMHRQFEGVGFAEDDPIFILGMPRSGSSLVEKILSCHPGIHAAGEIDTFYQLLIDQFGRNYATTARTAAPMAWRRLGRRYCEKIREGVGVDLTFTDKMPINFRYLGFIHLALPRARIIHTRRSALDTCVSCFSTPFVYDQPFSWNLEELGRYWAAYESLMKHWARILPENSFLDVDYEALVNDPEGQSRRILAFCGLSWDQNCLSFHEKSGSVRTASWTQVRQPIYKSSIGRAALYDKHLSPLRAALACPVG